MKLAIILMTLSLTTFAQIFTGAPVDISTIAQPIEATETHIRVPDDEADLQKAYYRVKTGGVIEVTKNITGSILTNGKKFVRLVSNDNAIITAPSRKTIIINLLNNSSITIQGITLKGGYAAVSKTSDSHVSIGDSVILGSRYGIIQEGGSGEDDWSALSLRNSLLKNCYGAGIVVNAGTARIESSRLTGNGTAIKAVNAGVIYLNNSIVEESRAAIALSFKNSSFEAFKSEIINNGSQNRGIAAIHISGAKSRLLLSETSVREGYGSGVVASSVESVSLLESYIYHFQASLSDSKLPGIGLIIVDVPEVSLRASSVSGNDNIGVYITDVPVVKMNQFESVRNGWYGASIINSNVTEGVETTISFNTYVNLQLVNTHAHFHKQLNIGGAYNPYQTDSSIGMYLAGSEVRVNSSRLIDSRYAYIVVNDRHRSRNSLTITNSRFDVVWGKSFPVVSHSGAQIDIDNETKDQSDDYGSSLIKYQNNVPTIAEPVISDSILF